MNDDYREVIEEFVRKAEQIPLWRILAFYVAVMMVVAIIVGMAAWLLLAVLK